MKFEVQATEVATGERRWLVLEGGDEAAVRRACEAIGLAVDSLREVRPPRPRAWTGRDYATVAAGVAFLLVALAAGYWCRHSPSVAKRDYEQAQRYLKAARERGPLSGGSGTVGYTASFAGGGADGAIYRLDPITVGSPQESEAARNARVAHAESEVKRARWMMISAYAAPVVAVVGLLASLWMFLGVMSRR